MSHLKPINRGGERNLCFHKNQAHVSVVTFDSFMNCFNDNL